VQKLHRFKITMSDKKIFCLLLTCLAFANHLHAQQSLPDIDKRANTLLERITYWGELYKTPTDYNDSLVADNERLMTYLKTACENPLTIRYGFPLSLESGLITSTSEDSLLRFYSWDTWMDPSFHCFNSLVQYNTPKGVQVKVLNNVSNLYKRGDPGSYVTDIVTVKTKDSKTVYLATDCSIVGNDRGYEVKAYTIRNDSLVATPFFKAGSRITPSLDYAYRENYTGDSTGGFHGQFNTIHFSEDKTKLYMPIISNTGRMDSRYYIYKFNGDMYVYRKRGDDKQSEMMK
jgi:hypothetical protein